MWPKTAAPAGGTGAFPEQKSPSPGESGSRLLAGANASVLAPVLPWLRCCPGSFSNKNRGSPSRRSLPVPVQPPLHAANCSGQAAFLRGPRGVTHTKAPCASALPGGHPGLRAPHPGRAGRAPRPDIRAPNPHPPFRGHPYPPGLKMRLPSAGHNPHPRKRAPERQAQRSLQAHRAALSKLLAGRGAERHPPPPIPAPRRPDPPGWRRRGTPKLAHL